MSGAMSVRTSLMIVLERQNVAIALISVVPHIFRLCASLRRAKSTVEPRKGIDSFGFASLLQMYFAKTPNCRNPPSHTVPPFFLPTNRGLNTHPTF